MLRKLGFLLVGLGLVLPVSAAERPGSIKGYVRSASGVPQMGAMVEVLGSAVQSLRVFTDENGFYSAAGLHPGTYSIKVSAPSFLPALREQIGLRPGANAVVNVTLNTLFEALQLTPASNPAEEDDWKWVLRSVSNRPILRMLDDGSVVLASKAEQDDHDLRATLSLLAGSESGGFGSTSDVTTGFSVEKSIFSTGTVAVAGNVGYNSGSPNAVLRASYSHRMPNGSEPQVAITMRRLAGPDVNLRSTDLQALSLTTSDDFTLGNVLELRFGSELQTIQFMGRVNAFRPFGSADLHVSPNTVIEYAYATSQPDGRIEKGFETAPADLSESGPHMSMAGFTPALERAHHQELSLSRRIGKTNLQFAVYADRIADPALTGVGEPSGDSGEVLPDIYSGTFTYQGTNLDTRGLRVVLQRKVTSDITATLDYGYGGVLDLARPDVSLEDAREWTATRNRHTIAAKVSGKVPCSKTRWIASYRWVNGQALTPVDMFNASPGQADPYLNIFFRQPIPRTGFLPGRMEAMIDVRNLLAQGYVPVLGQDGRTVYLVQSARAVRGGVSFTF
ncbi:MAG TPA: carboxypeptidase-like regulatory domain-containing protein [Terriglobales bacterium]|nr:carboxypeptidase-like regulatory domain-containing protein [Terriglobales bacterium]